MGGAVGADQARAVDGEAHRQLLDGDVVHHLVVGALQEGGIDGAERLHAVGGHAGGEGHRVLLGDADVEAALGMRLGEQIEPGAARHGGGDRDDLGVAVGLLDQRLGEHLGVGGRGRLGLGLGAGGDVELDHAVILVGRGFRRPVALALLRHDVQQHRADAGIAHVLQHRQDVVEVVAVDRPDIIEAQLLEQRAAHQEAAGVLHRAGDGAVDGAAEAARELLADVAQGQVGLARQEPRQIGRHGADRGRDRHVVVVQHHDQARIHGAGIVERLIGHAAGHRAVADHRDDVVGLALDVARHGEAERRRHRGRGVAGAERVVGALAALGEAAEAAALAQRRQPVAPAGQHLVGIGLVADVPDQLVVGRVEHIVQRHGELDHAEPGAEMAAGLRHHLDHLLAEFAGELGQLVFGQLTQVGRSADTIEQRGFRHRDTRNHKRTKPVRRGRLSGPEGPAQCGQAHTGHGPGA